MGATRISNLCELAFEVIGVADLCACAGRGGLNAYEAKELVSQITEQVTANAATATLAAVSTIFSAGLSEGIPYLLSALRAQPVLGGVSQSVRCSVGQKVIESAVTENAIVQGLIFNGSYDAANLNVLNRILTDPLARTVSYFLARPILANQIGNEVANIWTSPGPNWGSVVVGVKSLIENYFHVTILF